MPTDAYNAAQTGGTTNPSSPAGTCPFQLKEVGIIPVRYALDGAIDNEPLYPLPDGANWKPPFKLNQQYNLRQLRDGWLYVFSKKLGKLHTYKVEGDIFTAHHEGGTCAACLTYDSDDTLWLSFAPNAWTERLITLFSGIDEGKTHRNQWMRKLDIKAFKQHMVAPHCGLAKDLEASMADIGAVSQDIINSFTVTSTPLEAETSSPNSEFIKVKQAGSAPTHQAALPQANIENGLFIALDDPLADITDIALKLGTLHAQKELVFGDDEDKHKLLMSDLVRSIAHVPYDPKNAPSALQKKLKDNPQETLKFEATLNEYLVIESGLNQYKYDHNAFEGVKTLEPRKQELLAELKNQFSYQPTAKDTANYEQRNKNISEINWEGMSTFLNGKYSELDELKGDVAPIKEDLDNAIISLGVNALRVGVDIENEQGQSFFNQLFLQLFTLMTAVSSDWKAPKNQSLMALAPYYYSPEFQSVIFQKISNDAVSFSNASDDTNMVSRLGEIYGWLDDGRIPDTDDTIKAAINNVLSAAKKAFSKAGNSAWEGLLDGLFPFQTHGENNLASGLRFIVARSLISDDSKITFSKDYVKNLEAFNSKLTPFLQTAQRQSSHLHAQNTTAMRDALGATKQKIADLIASEMPLLIKLDKEAMTAVRTKLTGYFSGLRERTISMVGKANKSLESINGADTVIGGFAAICNLWNLMVVSQQVTTKLKQAGTPQEQVDVYIELASTVSWTLSAFAGVGRDAQVIANEFVNKSVQSALRQASNIEQVAIKRFAAAAKVTAIFGFFAASTEGYLTFKQAYNSDDWFEATLLTGKGFALGAQGIVSGFQLFNLASQTVILGEIIAAWMVSTLFYAGIAYLIFSGLYNYFHRDEMQKWLRGSSWGKSPIKQTAKQELMGLEDIIWKPNIELTTKSVDIYLPSYLFDDEKQHYDLKVVVNKKKSTSYADIATEMKKPSKLKVDVTQRKRKKTSNGVSYITVPVTYDEGDTVVIAINYDRAWTESCQSYVGKLTSTGTFDLKKTQDVIRHHNGVAGLKLPTAG
ncbi:hypothetical protein SKA34_13220 [Photobacterium sp. SKA34]|uniref:toxin VasX n=1 Tax=Photobacterium sp. SKA34 TaxID=121723 RepID=UPI00006BDBF4|nr:toxin VasX [Photobacterium sp. SKA34]EAR56156.1 hypothetical protein SKA34_13220 [Photobacterium sp. SKA34]